MSHFEVNHLTYGNSVYSSYTIRDEIDVAPEYQRNGDVWSLSKKQLLMDSLINRYDLPKIYFHKLRNDAEGRDYAIIDGRQRLEAIWQFIDGDYSLGEDIDYLKDKSIDLRGMTYNDLAKNHPKIKNQFDGTLLPIMVVDTDDLDLIEDMFSRLNEAVPLNAAEKRNAIRGHCIEAVTKLSKQNLFTKKVRFSNRRYQHREAAIKLLYLEHCLSTDGKIIDIKKVYLDGFAKKFKKSNRSHIETILHSVGGITKYLASIFTDKDKLLTAQASLPVYFLVARHQLHSDGQITLTRKQIEDFQDRRRDNRIVAEDSIESAEFELLEYDRMSQQGTNDASSLKERTRIMLDYI
ncbi:DUF262 domain-containing protein [Cellvibrio sp. PSBB006]|uniref:DUF262 domain-containing protein n=1 Tax=Cellvibrio sp. PSBB006 TaxID=1987723 RepID=UPI000B3B4DB9|nr:DUF262 domain-containing protein [Cellvibrio sp. PSBB006]ARU29072.1 hypothetical protein CBR65_17410 [Cellvibrio sp. PSBB006]